MSLNSPVLIDLPSDVQTTEIEFDVDTYEPLPVIKPAATRAQIAKALDMLAAAERPIIIAGGGVIGADASDLLVEFAELTGVPVIPTLMGWGSIPDDHPLMQGMAGIHTSQRYGNATLLASDFVLGIGNRWANRHTGALDVYREGRTFVHVDIEPTQIGRIFPPDYSIVSDAGAALRLFVEVARERKNAGKIADRSEWVEQCAERKQTLQRRTHFDNVPMKPQRVYEEMNTAFGQDVRYVSTIGLSQIAATQFLHVYRPRHWNLLARTACPAVCEVRGSPRAGHDAVHRWWLTAGVQRRLSRPIIIRARHCSPRGNLGVVLYQAGNRASGVRTHPGELEPRASAEPDIVNLSSANASRVRVDRPLGPTPNRDQHVFG